MSTSRKPSSSCKEPPKSGDSERTIKEATWPLDHLVEIDEDGATSMTLEITVRFLRGYGFTEDLKEAVLNTIKKDKLKEWGKGRETWEDWANVRFKVITSGKANIQVGFNPHDGSWCYVGQESMHYDADTVTLNLGDLEGYAKPGKKDFGTILHEFGHALGLMHEHQSPIRDANVDQMIRRNASDYIRRFGNAETMKNQMLNTVDPGMIANLSRFDPKSIMMYQIDGLTDKPNTELSTIDKAFIMLNYPPDLTDYGDDASKKRLERFMQAIINTGLQTEAGKILDAFKNPGPVLGKPIEKPVLAQRLEAVRTRFSEANEKLYLRRPNKNISQSMIDALARGFALPDRDPRSEGQLGLTDPTLTRQYGVTDPVGNVMRNKLFQSIVKLMVRNTLMQRGVPTRVSIPGASPTEVAKTIQAISMTDELARFVGIFKDDFQDSEETVASLA